MLAELKGTTKLGNDLVLIVPVVSSKSSAAAAGPYCWVSMLVRKLDEELMVGGSIGGGTGGT